MSLDLAHLFSTTYLFNMNPGAFLPVFFKILIPLFALMIIAGIASFKLAQKNNYAPIKKLFHKFYVFFITLGLLGLLYVFFRQQSIYLLSAPFLLLLWLIGTLTWLGFILKYYFTDQPGELKQAEAKAIKNKYLP